MNKRNTVYVTFAKIKPPTCGFASCMEITHHVRVKLGPALLGPIRTLLAVSTGEHEALYKNLMAHHRATPDCVTCKAIREVTAIIEAAKGGPL